jgi:glycosyl transferase family 25
MQTAKDIRLISGLFINLDRSAARRAHMEELATAAGLCLRRLQAVDGFSLSDEEYDRVHPAVPNQRRMTKWEVACFLSHRKAWHEICEKDTDYAAVFEDDIYFGTALRTILSEGAWIRRDMDLIKLDKATRKHVEFGERVEIAPGLELRRMLSLHVGCGGYIVSKAFARKLIEKTQTFHMPVDHFLFNPKEAIFKQANIWQALPAVCIHQQFSDDDFLPSNAELSSLQSSRHQTIRSHQKRAGLLVYVARKAGKEFARPIISVARFSYKKLIGLSRGTSWQRVEFKKDL